MRTVLIPLDGSEMGDETLSYALEHLPKDNVRLILFHCMDLNYLYANAPMLSANFPELEALDRERNQKYLEAKVAWAQEQGFEARSILAFGEPVLRILLCAESEKVDQILLSTHGRSGLSRFFMGSVAEGVIRRSPVPVLIVPSSVRKEAGRDRDPVLPDLVLP
jgi:nucleotide-binding universal stress UspA family protein